MTKHFSAVMFLCLPPLFDSLSLLPGSLAKAEVEKGQICETRSIMTLAWTICLIDPKRTPEELHGFIEEGMTELVHIDEWMSEWKPNSLITQINNQAGVRPVKVDDDALDAIQASIDEGARSGGAFDITFNAFFGLYNWKPGHERFPTDDEIKRLLPLVDYRNVVIDSKQKTVFLKKKGMKIGLGGMGEGWAIDKLFKLYEPKKIQAGYIDASGGVRVWGKKPSGKLWTIGVGNPRPMNPDESRKQSLFNLYTTDVAVTTAGDTEKYFIIDGKRYHHIIDPKTGKSAQNSIQVTAICKTATICDLVDDSVYIKGPIEGKAYAEKSGVAAVIIDPDKKITLTSNLKKIQTQWGPALDIDKGARLK